MATRWFKGELVGLAAVLLAACASDQGPAETAIKAAESAVNSVIAEATKYVPEQARGVQDALKAAKDSLAKGDYKAALAGSTDVTAKAKALGDAVAAKKAELATSWENMSGGLPKVVEAIKSRVDILSQSKKLPANMDKAAVDSAKSGLEAITKTWTDAQAAFKNGQVADAVTKGNAVKAQAVDVMTKLGMEVPAALKS
jgi:hypothetical protein